MLACSILTWQLSKVTLAAGMILCGWGRGRFRELSTSPFDADKELDFTATPDGLAILDNLATFSELLDAAKKNKPDNCKICYHKSSQDPEGSWAMQQDCVYSSLHVCCSLLHCPLAGACSHLPAHRRGGQQVDPIPGCEKAQSASEVELEGHPHCLADEMVHQWHAATEASGGDAARCHC